MLARSEAAWTTAGRLCTSRRIDMRPTKDKVLIVIFIRWCSLESTRQEMDKLKTPIALAFITGVLSPMSRVIGLKRVSHGVKEPSTTIDSSRSRLLVLLLNLTKRCGTRTNSIQASVACTLVRKWLLSFKICLLWATTTRSLLFIRATTVTRRGWSASSQARLSWRMPSRAVRITQPCIISPRWCKHSICSTRRACLSMIWA